MKRIAILQSNYIPWKGYFDIINSVDEFVFYDEAQFTRRDWRNRNIIKTRNGLKWLTIPVEVKSKYYQKIKDTRIADTNWAFKHWETIRHSYSSAPYFDTYADLFEVSYLYCRNLEFLCDVNRVFINLINSILGITTLLKDSSKYNLKGDRNEKIISICKQTGAEIYYSGPSAKNYIDENLFDRTGIRLYWLNYENYPEYIQQFPPFIHTVSIIDLIFNTGDKCHLYMKSF